MMQDGSIKFMTQLETLIRGTVVAFFHNDRYTPMSATKYHEHSNQLTLFM